MSWLLQKLIRLYQVTISPLLGPQCRYYPTCSAFAVDSLKIHGFFKGTALFTWRILRCNPWSRGGVDHVPPKGKWIGRRVPEADLDDDACGHTHPEIE